MFKVSRRKITVEKDLFRPSRLLSYLIQSRALKPIHSFFFQVTTVSGQSSSGIHVSWHSCELVTWDRIRYGR